VRFELWLRRLAAFQATATAVVSPLRRQHTEKYLFALFVSLTADALSLWLIQIWVSFSIPKIILVMADGLSVAASVVGIAATALQSVQILSRTIDNIMDVLTPLRASESISRQSNPFFVARIQPCKAIFRKSS
jgi:hypothetical protein